MEANAFPLAFLKAFGLTTPIAISKLADREFWESSLRRNFWAIMKKNPEHEWRSYLHITTEEDGELAAILLPGDLVVLDAIGQDFKDGKFPKVSKKLYFATLSF